jgi:cell division protein FtsW
MAFFTRLKNIMERAPDNFSRLVVTGILAWLSTQALINIGSMIGLLPLKGITLPFISYGGTSIIFVTAAVGLAFNISRYTTYTARAYAEEGRSHDNPAYRRGDRRSRYAYSSRRI